MSTTPGVYIAATDAATGKATVSLGFTELLSGRVGTVGVFRPVVKGGDGEDWLLQTLRSRFPGAAAYEDCFGTTYDAVHADREAAFAEIVAKYRALAARCDAVVAVGSDFTEAGAARELGFNVKAASHLGLPLVLLTNGRARTPAEIADTVRVARAEAEQQHATVFAVAVNRVPSDLRDEVRAALAAALDGHDLPTLLLPEVPSLTAPTVHDLAAACDGELVGGDPTLMSREADDLLVSAMSLPNVLERLTNGAAVIMPGDRAAALLPGIVGAHHAANMPALAGVVLTGGFETPAPVARLLDGLSSRLPRISTKLDTFETAVRLAAVKGRITADATVKIDTALTLFARSVDGPALLDRLRLTRSTAVTPLMFEAGLLERARSARKTIVLPESGDERVLRAADILLRRDAVDLVLLGAEPTVRRRAAKLGLDLEQARIIDPCNTELRDLLAEEYAKLRAHKGVTIEQARDAVGDVSYFGTMLVQLGLADGMVSGAAHTTAHTIRPSFEIIKTAPGTDVVSSVFFMCLPDKVLVYGDCAVNPDPTAEQLADIAVSSARTAAQFGVEPRVALLSYSTGDSGTGADVDKVRHATKLAREQADLLGLDYPIEGPIQYDAASDPDVAATKMPDSPVAGQATVFVVPNLDTGNNLYKAVQRTAGALAVGPVLQGLRKPVNDLSRGCLVDDIVNTVVITAIQAQ